MVLVHVCSWETGTSTTAEPEGCGAVTGPGRDMSLAQVVAPLWAQQGHGTSCGDQGGRSAGTAERWDPHRHHLPSAGARMTLVLVRDWARLGHSCQCQSQHGRGSGTALVPASSVSCRAFFWLVSLLLSSLIWFIAVKASDPQDERLQKGLLIFGVMFSVLLQEAFRFLYYKLLR